MTSALNLILESEISEQVIRFLRTRGARARIMAPDWVRDRVMSGALQNRGVPAATWINDSSDLALQANGPCNVVVIAEDAVQEESIVKSLVLLRGSKIFGLFNHVMPALICHTDGFAQRAPIKNLKRYAILCLPRSGSRYLGTTLSAAGVGAPLEHVRDPLVAVITQGQMGFVNAIKTIEAFGQANCIFGTKLVSTFLIEASAKSLSRLNRHTEWMKNRGYEFVYLVRPLEDSVVSSYIAFQLKKWHFFGEVDSMTKAKFDALVFDDRAIWEEYVRFLADRIIMDHIAKMHGMAWFKYDIIRDNVGSAVAWLCERLQIDMSSLTRASMQVPIATRNETSVYEAFTERLNTLLESRRNEQDGRLIRRLRERTGLKKQGAENLLKEHRSQS